MVETQGPGYFYARIGLSQEYLSIPIWASLSPIYPLIHHFCLSAASHDSRPYPSKDAPPPPHPPLHHLKMNFYAHITTHTVIIELRLPPRIDGILTWMQNMPAHALLTKADEATLAIKIQDWFMLNQKSAELEVELGRPPTHAEWAAEFGQSERVFMERWKDGNRVS